MHRVHFALVFSKLFELKINLSRYSSVTWISWCRGLLWTDSFSTCVSTHPMHANDKCYITTDIWTYWRSTTFKLISFELKKIARLCICNDRRCVGKSLLNWFIKRNLNLTCSYVVRKYRMGAVVKVKYLQGLPALLRGLIYFTEQSSY